MRCDSKTAAGRWRGRVIWRLGLFRGGVWVERLVFPRGVWLTGPIVLRSNIALHTEEGALIQFSSEHSLYSTPGLIYGEDLENIAFTGPGIIDGAGGPRRTCSLRIAWCITATAA